MALAWTQRVEGFPALEQQQCVVADGLLVVLGFPLRGPDDICAVLLDPRDCSWRSLPRPEARGFFCAAAVRHEVFVFHARQGPVRALRLDTRALRWRAVEVSGPGPSGNIFAYVLEDRIFIFSALSGNRIAYSTGIFAFDTETGSFDLLPVRAPFVPLPNRSVAVGSRLYCLENCCSLKYWDSASGESGRVMHYGGVGQNIRSTVLLVLDRYMYALGRGYEWSGTALETRGESKRRRFGVEWRWSGTALCYAVDADEWTPVPVGGVPPSDSFFDCAAVVGDRAFVFMKAIRGRYEGEVHVLELELDLELELAPPPTLLTLCLLAVRRHCLDARRLPPALRKELELRPPSPVAVSGYSEGVRLWLLR